jgi:DNA repair photolyase
MRVKIGEIKCKTILGKSGIRGVDYSVNPYLGCSHGCAYCYARFMRRMGHKGESWGTFVDIKVNALDRLKVEAPRKKKGKVLLSSVTDPYQPLERKHKITRGVLKILLEHQFPVSILTKSDLVVRDLDLIRKFDVCDVGFTITAFNEKVRQAFEPGASSIEARLAALKVLSGEGISTWAFISPILPYLTEEGLESLLNELAGCVGHILVDRLNVKAGNMPDIRSVLEKRFPNLKKPFEAALKDESDYYTVFKRNVAEMCHRRSIPLELVY